MYQPQPADRGTLPWKARNGTPCWASHPATNPALAVMREMSPSEIHGQSTHVAPPPNSS
ncbi:hypothetical protein L210DRAFT_938768 [Boletus edulis BED1]|uniref:Uncharacterized protein n=1 Tax=Boletus edulis BED1 TaxID=1328754 RepID=A0AAD4C9L5_BOLED|nr:hypothetical protein L210DRAFT_938768 [Boletus edulis BED1]